MTSKTISLTGNELAVTGLSGANAHIRNDSTSVVYAAKMPGVSAGADEVTPIPAGQSVSVRGIIGGAVYLLGTGSVYIQSDDIASNPFRNSAASGGSGADSVARAAIEAHAADTDIHVNAEEKAGWNGLSSPNLLINPDFAINQRGKATISAGADRVFFADRWHAVNLDVTIGNGITVKGSGANGFIQQIVEHGSYYIGKAMAISADIDGQRYSAAFVVPTAINGIASQEVRPGVSLAVCNYMNSTISGAVLISGNENHGIDKIKLEHGSVATPFLPPDPALELLKCQRYFVRLRNAHEKTYAYNGTGYIMSATLATITFTLPASMRIVRPTAAVSGENIPCIITPSVAVKTPLEGTLSGTGAMVGNAIALTFTISGGAVGEPAVFLLKPGNDYIDFSAEL